MDTMGASLSILENGSVLIAYSAVLSFDIGHLKEPGNSVQNLAIRLATSINGGQRSRTSKEDLLRSVVCTA
jgi:hypothetical protein